MLRKKLEELCNHIKYRFDKRMAKGTTGLVLLLLDVTIILIILLTLFATIFNLSDKKILESFWDFLASTINAWIPSMEDYSSFAYTLINAIAAIIGVLFTSVLIGLISNAIEIKINNLRNGNSKVLEEKHIVVLGYNSGEHELLKQLIISTGNKRKSIVICSDIDKHELEDELKECVTIPENVEIICRHGDITKPNDLVCCSISQAKIVIINALSDSRRIKTLLAVNSLLKDEENHPKIVCCVSSKSYLLPKEKMFQKNILMLQTDRIMAKLLAHTAIEPGSSLVYKELLNFNGNEMYFEKNALFTNKTILELVQTISEAIVIGIYHDNEIILNPSSDLVVTENDELILIEETRNAYSIHKHKNQLVYTEYTKKINPNKGKKQLVIFGNNDILPMILDELPQNVETTIVSKEKVGYNKAKRFRGEINDDNLLKLINTAEHVIILSDHDSDREDADVNNILLLLRLLNLKEKNNLDTNITVELNLVSSCNALVSDTRTDFVVTSEISSLVLAQVVEDYRVINVYEKLLANEGISVYSKNIKKFGFEIEKEYNILDLYLNLSKQGYTLIGFVYKGQIIINPQKDSSIIFNKKDHIIALG